MLLDRAKSRATTIPLNLQSMLINAGTWLSRTWALHYFVFIVNLMHKWKQGPANLELFSSTTKCWIPKNRVKEKPICPFKVGPVLLRRNPFGPIFHLFPHNPIGFFSFKYRFHFIQKDIIEKVSMHSKCWALNMYKDFSSIAPCSLPFPLNVCPPVMDSSAAEHFFSRYTIAKPDNIWSTACTIYPQDWQCIFIWGALHKQLFSFHPPSAFHSP